MLVGGSALAVHSGIAAVLGCMLALAAWQHQAGVATSHLVTMHTTARVQDRGGASGCAVLLRALNDETLLMQAVCLENARGSRRWQTEGKDRTGATVSRISGVHGAGSPGIAGHGGATEAGAICFENWII